MQKILLSLKHVYLLQVPAEPQQAAGLFPAVDPLAAAPNMAPHNPLATISEDGVGPASHAPAASPVPVAVPRMLGSHLPQGPGHQGPVSVAAAGRAGSAPGRIQDTGHADILQDLLPERPARSGGTPISNDPFGCIFTQAHMHKHAHARTNLEIIKLVPHLSRPGCVSTQRSRNRSSFTAACLSDWKFRCMSMYLCVLAHQLGSC